MLAHRRANAWRRWASCEPTLWSGDSVGEAGAEHTIIPWPPPHHTQLSLAAHGVTGFCGGTCRHWQVTRVMSCSQSERKTCENAQIIQADVHTRLSSQRRPCLRVWWGYLDLMWMPCLSVSYTGWCWPLLSLMLESQIPSGECFYCICWNNNIS